MKYIVIFGDGMSDYPVKELGGKTLLQCSKKPMIDYLAEHGEMGLVKTVPDGVEVGSDTANLSVLGYNPLVYYSGRSHLEAIGLGVHFNQTDMTFRFNLITLSDDIDYRKKRIIDHSAGKISTEEANELPKEDIEVIKSVAKSLLEKNKK